MEDIRGLGLRVRRTHHLKRAYDKPTQTATREAESGGPSPDCARRRAPPAVRGEGRTVSCLAEVQQGLLGGRGACTEEVQEGPEGKFLGIEDGADWRA